MIPTEELERRRAMLKELDHLYTRTVHRFVYRSKQYVVYAFTSRYEARTLAHRIRNTGKYTAVVKVRPSTPTSVSAWIVGFRLKKGAA